MDNNRTRDARDNDESAIIDDAERGPSGQGSAGGRLQRDIGTQDEAARATDPDAGLTRVEKADKEQRSVPTRSDHQGAQENDRG